MKAHVCYDSMTLLNRLSISLELETSFINQDLLKNKMLNAYEMC